MIELIPAIDLIGGKCVRLTQGDYAAATVYGDDPLDVARSLEDHGIRRLHVVDLDGAREGHIVNYRVLERLALRTSLAIDFGGGLKSDRDVEIAFERGARMVTGGSIAVREPERFLAWLARYGSDKIILGADARDGRIAINGWQDTTDEALLPFVASYFDRGIRTVICTDIGRDGMLQGPATALYGEIRESLPDVFLIASGGIGSIGDIERLDAAGIPAVIFGKALYEGRIRLKDLVRFADTHKTDM
ncbi:MAG: 1-(5-phosphoribosyl)-5-[(5-phosphoribosylamino)methylideneamino] imidazole-4-carboxamide isomerase [Tannerella sp.]|jgi:phosphoribosylformimino-5-aminoimidazole carboxamide ribotide isomerase|nr:1-(5-phosphoribosyl)-5-[(5-phosphoribosylamino)methylideneamino] imidazole-4-carboxamide isomerase [Tannerella sp.]